MIRPDVPPAAMIVDRQIRPNWSEVHAWLSRQDPTVRRTVNLRMAWISATLPPQLYLLRLLGRQRDQSGVAVWRLLRAGFPIAVASLSGSWQLARTMADVVDALTPGEEVGS